MSPSLSAHLLDTFGAQFNLRQTNIPFQLKSLSMSSIVTSGQMQYDAAAHGTQAFSFTQRSNQSFTESSFIEASSKSLERIATLQAKLNQKLGPEYISQRPAPGGSGKLSYIEGWRIISLANEVFGFNGWSSNIVNLSVDFIDCSEESKRYNVGVTAIVRVTLRDGVFHEDVGYGLLENSKSKGAAIDKCKKEAVTDALKRTLRNFGNLMGNCLYDKNYASEIVKIKVPPPKFDKSALHRRPEFDDRPSSEVPPQQSAMLQAKSSASGLAPPQQVHVKPDPISISRHCPPEQKTAAQASSSETPAGSTSNPRPLHKQEKSAYPTPRSERRLPLGVPITGNPNDSFDHAFPSSDDAFLANVDLEGATEVDLGRPIHGEEEATAHLSPVLERPSIAASSHLGTKSEDKTHRSLGEHRPNVLEFGNHTGNQHPQLIQNNMVTAGNTHSRPPADLPNGSHNMRPPPQAPRADYSSDQNSAPRTMSHLHQGGRRMSTALAAGRASEIEKALGTIGITSNRFSGQAQGGLYPSMNAGVKREADGRQRDKMTAPPSGVGVPSVVDRAPLRELELVNSGGDMKRVRR